MRAHLPDAGQLLAAEQAVSRHLAATPVVELAGRAGRVLLKVETVQPTGSFKIRGTLAALSAAPPEQPVVTASAGNHALGIARAAEMRGRSATVVVPETASAAKPDGLSCFDVRLVRAGAGYDAAERHALRLAADEDALFVSAYNDADVIAGQSTLAVELGARVSGPVTIVCPVGGGGLLAGVALWASEQPQARVVGVEAAASRALSAAVRAGHVVDVPIGATLTDGWLAALSRGRSRSRSRGATPTTSLQSARTSCATRSASSASSRDSSSRAPAAATAVVLAGRVVDRRPGARIIAVLSGRNITVETLLDVIADRSCR